MRGLGQLVAGPVALHVALVVPPHPHGRPFDQVGAVAGADLVEHIGHSVGDRLDVVAGQLDERHAVGESSLGDRNGMLVGRPRELREPVVLAEENHRQAAQSRQVERLVEGAGGHRAVSEERDHHAVLAASGERVGGADRDRQAGSDDAVRAENADRRSGDVHRPTPASAGARLLAHQLGQHPTRVESLGEHVTVPAMGRGDDVIGPGVEQRADGAGLLTDRRVHEAGDLPVLVEHGDALLHPADDGHPEVGVEQLHAVHVGDSRFSAYGTEAHVGAGAARVTQMYRPESLPSSGT